MRGDGTVDAAGSGAQQDAHREPRAAQLAQEAADLRAELAGIQAQVRDVTAALAKRELREDERATVRRLLTSGERLRLALERLQHECQALRGSSAAGHAPSE